jgi:predicted small metal-binding protein
MIIVTFRCAEVGLNCTYTLIARNKKEMFERIKNHAKTLHGMNKIPAHMAARIQTAIRMDDVSST